MRIIPITDRQSIPGIREILICVYFSMYLTENFYSRACFRSNLSVMQQSMTADDRPVRFTDSPQHYLPSTMSTTSGLGSNYTTSGMSGSMGGSTQPPTPSPRRKTSSTSFSEVPELQQRERLDNRQPIYVPGNYVDYRPHQVIEEVQNPAAYFGEWWWSQFCGRTVFHYCVCIVSRTHRFFAHHPDRLLQLFSLSTRSEFGLRTRL